MIGTTLLIIVAVLIAYCIYIYNKLIRLQNLTKEGWSGIDIQLKQRSSLIPNLIETVKGYMGHERSVLEDITKLRSQALNAGSIQERADTENMLTSALKQVFALAENYPDLKASTNFIELQQTLTSIEDQIQLARRYYNGAARDLNITIESFPSNLMANAFHFRQAAYFEIADAKERELPNVKFS
jgi:LemA protein